MSSRILCLAVLLALATPALHADEIQIGGKDRLSGTILGMRGNQVRIGTEHLGEVALPWAAVTDLRSDVDLAIYPEGAEVIIGVITRIDGGVLEIRTAEGIRTLDKSRVNLISTELPRGGKPAPIVKWRGKAEFGFGLVTGNKESNNYLIGTELRRRSPSTEILITAQAEKGQLRQNGAWERNVSYARGSVGLTRNQGGRLYLAGNTTLEQDDISRLTLRQNHAFSVGYRLIQGSPNYWHVELGSNYVWEKYNPLQGDDYSNDGMTLRLRSLTEWKVFGSSRLKLDIVANPSIEAPYGLRSTSNLSLAFPLTGALNLQLSATHDYNTNRRPAGVKASDLRTRTTLVYGF